MGSGVRASFKRMVGNSSKPVSSVGCDPEEYVYGAFTDEIQEVIAARQGLLSICVPKCDNKFTGEEFAEVIIKHRLCLSRHHAEILGNDFVEQGFIVPFPGNPPSLRVFQADRTLLYRIRRRTEVATAKIDDERCKEELESWTTERECGNSNRAKVEPPQAHSVEELKWVSQDD
mmetsp:Transcript_15716/g.31662  ORF Transcript_15716/g.31662 Transcript_15716/m.31662 type:complete len:174 (-) Transcript_15716:163-684(-)